MGGGVVKGLILQGFPSLCMSWCGYEMVMLHFILPSVFFGLNT